MTIKAKKVIIFTMNIFVMIFIVSMDDFMFGSKKIYFQHPAIVKSCARIERNCSDRIEMWKEKASLRYII